MPWNGSGVFERDYNWQNDAANSIPITASRVDGDSDDFVDGLNNCMTRDGQTSAIADISMGGNKLTSLATAVAATDAVPLGQLQKGAFRLLTGVSGSNTIVAGATPVLSAYATGQTFSFIVVTANTGATTININGLGAKAITKNGTNPLSSGDLRVGSLVTITYDGTQFQGVTGIGSNATQIDYLPPGTGALLTNLAAKTDERITPQNFGTKGDGVTTDTAALQLFFNYIGTSLGGATQGFTGTRGTRTGFIPAAHYIIDGPINIGPYLDLECDKRALFTAKAGYTGVLFYSVDGYQIRWSGGIFQSSANGAGGIWWIGNANYPASPHNADSGYCVFENFEAKGFQDVFPVLVNQSAQMSIKGFKLDRNIHFIGRGTNLNTTTGAYTQTPPLSGYGGFSDVILMQDGWITMSDLMSDNYDALICAKSVRLKDVLIVPVPHSGRECAYVNAWNYAVFDDVRYGGEPSSIAPVNWMGEFLSVYPVEQSGVIITNSRVYCASSQQTTLAVGISASDTTITLTDGSIFPITGEMYIGTERVNYINRVGNVFTCDARSSLSFAYSAGVTVSNKDSTIIRLFNDLPNIININGNSGGVELNNYISISAAASAGAYTNIQTNSSSPLFKCFIDGNNFQTASGDLGYFLSANTFLDYKREGAFRERSVTTGSPGLIRTEISAISCVRAKTYRLKATIYDGSGPYEQSIEGILAINKFYDGAIPAMYATFTKTSDFDPPTAGFPPNIDTVTVRFIYSNGGVSAGNTIPTKDRFIVRPLLELSASTGSISAGATVLWELMG